MQFCQVRTVKFFRFINTNRILKESYSMLIDEFKAFENELVDKVLYFAMGTDYSSDLEKAKDTFIKLHNENNYPIQEKNFSSWLLWEYRLENGKNFFEEYIEIYGSILTEEEGKILVELANTYVSIYESVLTDKKRKLKDIFTNEEFLIEEAKEEININEVIIGRIVSYNGMNYVLDDHNTLDRRFQNGVEKIFHEKYEEYKNKGKFLTKEQFIKDNPLLLYSFANIIEDLARNQIEYDTEYNVIQSNYVVLDNKKTYDCLLNSSNIEFDYKEKDMVCFIMYDQGKNRVLCEIILYKDKLEMECTSENDKVKAKKTLEKVANGLIQHVKDELLSIDDIL